MATTDLMSYIDDHKFVKARIKPRFYKQGIYMDRYAKYCWIEIVRNNKVYAFHTTDYAFTVYMPVFDHVIFDKVKSHQIKEKMYALELRRTPEETKEYYQLSNLYDTNRLRIQHRYMFLTKTDPKLP